MSHIIENINEADLILSQKEFTPSPFRNQQWEIVGEQIVERGFIPIELEVLHDDRAAPDPMFESFGGSLADDVTRFRQIEGDVVHFDTTAASPSSQDIQKLLDERYEAGKLEGYEEGVNAEKTNQAELNAKYQELFKQFDTEIVLSFVDLVTKLEHKAYDLALAISKKVLNHQIEHDPEYILRVIHEGFATLGVAQPKKILLSPQDAEFLQVVGYPAELQELNLEYVVDESVKSGCIIETSFGSVDLQIDTIWNQVKESLQPVVKKNKSSEVN
jgi:flagellar biosynthesis/type III secretory pathway protein FliH